MDFLLIFSHNDFTNISIFVFLKRAFSFTHDLLARLDWDSQYEKKIDDNFPKIFSELFPY